MKINLPIEEGYFRISPLTFCGLDAHLIYPEIDAKWNKDNLHFRSLILDKEGNVLSIGFPKFFNYGEKTDCYPNPEYFHDWIIQDKIDGSLLIVDFVNGVFSMRTRGTFSYTTQENYKDFELLPKKYPKISGFLKNNQNYSLLFEIVTPNNVIVVRPKEIEFYLIGAVDKETLELSNAKDLTEISKSLGDIPLPEQYILNDVDLKTIANNVKQWKGKEGVVLTYNNGQNKLKLKSDWYLQLHRIKSQLSSIKNLLEYYVQKGMPSYEKFYKNIETDFDFEIAEQLKYILQKISECGEQTKKDVKNMKDFCISIKDFKNRKQQAEHIKTNYGPYSSFVFNLLDGKELSESQWFKMINSKLSDK